MAFHELCWKKPIQPNRCSIIERFRFLMKSSIFPVLEKRKQKEQQRLMRERERLHKEEELRMKRDMRTQQILEVGSRELDSRILPKYTLAHISGVITSALEGEHLL